ncbi:unnamed protein product [Sphagnum jensenii]|uniref:Protein kinase domain-containing protein n=1 Tax=Sphagnum jensenii TaxID=128206 RepID=A0ABP0WSW4_9BRYO
MTTRISISLGLLLSLFFISSLIQIHKEYGVAAATLQSDVIAVEQILRAWGEETPSLQQNWNANGSSNLLDPCGAQWVGVSCSPSAVQSQHADYSSITSLQLYDYGIVGSLPSALSKLINLQYLNLSGNSQLRGSLPDEIAQHLTNLIQIDLSHCNLSGPIPTRWDALRNLELMDLSHNGFTGMVPDLLVSLPKLTQLNLSHNQFDLQSLSTTTTHMHSSERLLLHTSQESDDSSTKLAEDTQSAQAKQQQGKNIVKIVVPVVAAAVVILGLLLCCCLCAYRQKQNNNTSAQSRHLFASADLFDLHQQQMSCVILYEELKTATRNFHPRNKIGEGAFGAMYKGVLQNGTEVSIKQLSLKSRQDKHEFLKEVQVIASVHHPNIVRLLACSLTLSIRYLVYEYMDNKSLAQALFEPAKGMKLEWKSRFNIALGTAQGLAHLHTKMEAHLVHSDIKAINILLDKNLSPKIADLGLARLFQRDADKLHTFVAGARGYVAPEYALQGQLTSKADVFSYGIVLLELVSGRKNMNPKLQKDQQYLLSWAWELHEEDQALELIDPEVRETCDEMQAVLLMRIALLCTQDAPHLRPNMPRIIGMLTNQTPVTEVPIKPSILAIQSFSVGSSRASSATSFVTQEI